MLQLVVGCSTTFKPLVVAGDGDDIHSILPLVTSTCCPTLPSTTGDASEIQSMLEPCKGKD